MVSECEEIAVSELQANGILLVEDGNHGEYRPRPDEFEELGTAFIRAADMADGQVLFLSASRINQKAFTRIRKGVGKPGDILLSHKGTVGKVAFAPYDAPPFVCSPQTTFWRVLNDQRLDRAYLYAYMRSGHFKAKLSSRSGETDMAGYVSLTAQRQLKIPVPAIDAQRAVGSFLAALDGRIDNLRQINANLEAIAQALFKSWFVDFDPVRAKAEGREPEGMDATTAALFPSEFEDSELGPIPRGWSIARFDREFDFTMGQSPPGSTYNMERIGVPFFQGCTDFGDVFPAERVYCSQPTRFARARDLLMSVRAPVGALNIAGADCSIGRGLCAIRHKSGSTGLTQEFVKACMARIENAAGEGALFNSLSKQQLASLPVLVANKTITDAMASLLDPLTSRRIAAAQQAEHLMSLRDTLLPRLISGKLRLAEAALADAGA